jgi:hypothetical protein
MSDRTPILPLRSDMGFKAGRRAWQSAPAGGATAIGAALGILLAQEPGPRP